MPTRKRDLTNTLSFAVLHFGVAFTVAYALTGSSRDGESIRCCGMLNPG